MRTTVVFDLEYTAWEGSMAHRWLRPGEFKEIVQIGAVKLDADSLAEIGMFNALVRPRINSTLSPYLEALTGITNSDVRRHGCDFADAFAAFLRFSEGATWCAFGHDEWAFEDNCRLYGLSVPPMPEFRNARLWFRNSGFDTRGLHSCDIGPKLGVPFDGHRHNALANSRSIVSAMRVLVARGATNLFSDGRPAAKTAA